LTTFCSELSLGVFLKVVGMDVNFPMALGLPYSDVYNLSYDQNTTHRSTWSCTLPRLRKNQLFHPFLFRIKLRCLHQSCRYWCLISIEFGLTSFRHLQLELWLKHCTWPRFVFHEIFSTTISMDSKTTLKIIWSLRDPLDWEETVMILK